MKKISFFTIMLLSLFTFSSCASIFCGRKAKVTFFSDVEEATLTIDGQKFSNVTFPYTTKIRRGFDDTIVKVEAPSYDTETIYVYKNFNPVSILNMFEILGWGIDAATGAITKPEFKFYDIKMKSKKYKSLED